MPLCTRTRDSPSAEQLLLTTLVVKLAVVGGAGDDARAVPLVPPHPAHRTARLARAAGVRRRARRAADRRRRARLLLDYDAADLTLVGRLSRRPDRRARTPARSSASMVGRPGALRAANGSRCPSRSAAASPAAACARSVRRKRSGTSRRSSSPTSTIAWRMLRQLPLDWQVILVTAPVLLELLRQALGHRCPARTLRLPRADDRVADCRSSCSRRCSASRSRSRSGTARASSTGSPEQEKLLMAARVEALANQINPHFLFNTLTSISSLIRSKPETARMLIVKLSGAAPPAAAQPGALRHAARGAGGHRRVPRHRAHPLRPELRRREGHRRPTAST